MNKLISYYLLDERRSILSFALICLLTLLGAVYLENSLLALIPFLILAITIPFFKIRWLFFAFFLIIPFSIEYYFPGGFATDLPSEPLMLLLTGISIVWALLNVEKIKLKYISHPITILLLLHLIWMSFCAFNSSFPVISTKFLLAKIWYVIPFFFLPFFVLSTPKRVSILIACMGASLSFVVLFVMLKHSTYGFSFKEINRAVLPFYRNHVNYACILVIFMPAFYHFITQQKKNKFVFLSLGALFLVYLAAIYFSYTRAAHLSIFIAFAAYWVIKLRFMRIAILSTIIGIVFVLAFFLRSDSYLEYAPDFEKAVTHYKFDNLISATAKGEDISTMERVYRWVAGIQMIEDRPIVGFGPGTFYSNYKGYTISSFKTYVSNNPDHSGVHNYYLMTTIEQGILGGIIFLSFCFFLLIYGESLYHRIQNPEWKSIVMMALLMLVIINAILIINDMLESDKVGPFFFLAASLLVIADIKTRDKKTYNNLR